MRVVDLGGRRGGDVERLKRLLLVALLVATRADATVTVDYFGSYDVNTPGTAAESTNQFSGGISTTNKPTFVTNSVFPGTANSIALDLNLSAADGLNVYGTILLSSAQSQVSVGALAYPTAGVLAKCVGGVADGKVCLDDTYCSSLVSHDGVCTPQRTPLLTLGTASARGCTLYQSRICAYAAYPVVGRTCGTLGPILYEVGYGTIAAAPYTGICSSSRSMDGTPCGAGCTSATAATACIQGRTATDITNGSTATSCVKNADEATACDAGAGSNCHCLNECDENRPFESQCAPGIISALTSSVSTAVGLQLEQENGSTAGEVKCSLRTGAINASSRPEIFPRGSTPAALQKVGVCQGGTYPVDGGRKGTACCNSATCADGTAGLCACDTASNGYNAATCTAGTSCSVTARISPDRVTFGTSVATDKTRTLLDQVLIQKGSGTHVRNWRGETLRADGTTGTDASMWTGTRTGCGTASTGGCFRGGGTIGNEPDANTSSLETANESVVESITFENLKTSGTDYAAADQPIAAALNAAAQDRSQNTTEGVIVQMEAYDGTTASTGYNPSNRTGCTAPGNCLGYFLQDNFDRGNSSVYEQMPSKLITTDLTAGTALNALSDANATTAISNLQGRFQKQGYDGTGAGTTTKGRLTFATLETVLSIANPTPPSVLPGNDRIAWMGDSRCDKTTLFQNFVSRMTEPTAIYKQCRGGVAMGDLLLDFTTLLAGGNGAITTQAYSGTAGQAIDVAFIEVGINTLHNAVGTLDPGLPTAYGGIAQRGYCEDWTGSGYGLSQGKPCSCANTTNWSTGGLGIFTTLSLVKNASFGTSSTTAPACTTSNAANGYKECQMGGSAPGAPGTITEATCTASVCPATSNLVANAVATDRTWRGHGCSATVGDMHGCSGVCLTGNTVVRMMDGVAEMTRRAAASASNPTLVWVTTPYATATSTTNTALYGWWNIYPKVRNWNATLLAWAKANSKNFVDLSSYLIEKCGIDTMRTASAVNACESDGIHYRPDVLTWEADLMTACATNTTLAGVSSKTTDGVCTVGAANCVSSKCGSGLRQGAACTGDADCDYCSAGSPLKLGKNCSADADCGRYRCVF
ncbi:MAG: hypothetical protein ABIR79_12625 [Candidatus Binatia bacterium]